MKCLNKGACFFGMAFSVTVPILTVLTVKTIKCIFARNSVL